MIEQNTTELKGRVHSFESLGTLDGPGIRFVIFFAGCPLRCQYCHNIDMVINPHATEYTVEDIMKMIRKNREYFEHSNGGVTVSGGDPVFQPLFTAKLLEQCHSEGFHTAVDTSLFASQQELDLILPYTDLFMVSVKQMDNAKHQELTSAPNKLILENLKYLSQQGKKIIIRYLVLPGYTDDMENITSLINFVKTINVEAVEILRYHTMGIKKWEHLGLNYKLKHVVPPDSERMDEIRAIFEEAGLKVISN